MSVSSIASFSCGNCNKTYKRVSAYQKHYSICRIIRRKSKDNGEEEGDGNGDDFSNLSCLSKEEMGSILKDILVKYQIMEQKVDELTKCVSMKKKKVNVIEWLNVNRRIIKDGLKDSDCIGDFNKWIKSIKINRDHLEYVFTNSFVKLFSYIITQLTEENKQCIPMCAFTHKDCLLYVYNNGVQSWESIAEEQLANLVSLVSSQINAEFKLWQDEHKALILSNEKYHDLYLNNINKVLYTNYKKDSELSGKITRELYNCLKVNITI